MAFVVALPARLNLSHALRNSVFFPTSALTPSRASARRAVHRSAAAADAVAVASAEPAPGGPVVPTPARTDRPSSRARRRAVAAARVDAHRAVARARERGDALVRVRVPGAQLVRAGLPAALAHVKVFVPVSALDSDAALRQRICDGIARLFPEVVQRGLLTGVEDFELAVGNVRLARGSDDTLRRALRRFTDADGRPSDVFAEMLLNNLPPPLPALTPRRSALTRRAVEAREQNSLLRIVSFYKFVPIERPDVVCSRLLKLWKDMGVLGRVYVATEGVNAQLAVPIPLWSDFEDAIAGLWRERNEPLVPEELVGVFLNCDRDVLRGVAPFDKLHVRPREKVLADGFDEPLDWTRAGKEISPETWHEMLHLVGHPRRDGGCAGSDPTLESGTGEKTAGQAPIKPIILDCRNDYESEVGRFEGSEPLGTSTFRESWDRLEDRLARVPRDVPIMTFCTGGIRCNKINAYLEQKMGFTNTARLAGGIVSYARTLKEQGRLDESHFKGVNHVFDGRVGEVITEDALSRCINCGSSTNVQTDCANVHCPRPFQTRMFVQCPDCAVRLSGACCSECSTALGAASPAPCSDHDISLSPEVHRDLENAPGKEKQENVRIYPMQREHDIDYVNAMMPAEPAVLIDLRQETEARYPGCAHVLSSKVQASLLKMLVGLTNAHRVLEIGTFTGYSTLFMARALSGEAGTIVTCESNAEVAAIAASYFKRDAPYGAMIDLRVGDAKNTLREMQEGSEEPFDLVFLDGDKNYEIYYRLLMEGGLLRKGGLLVVDNVLFGGHVSRVWKASALGSGAAVAAEVGNSLDGVVDGILARKRLKSLENALRIARKIEAFNRVVASDPCAEVVVLPIRDGLSLIRRRK